VTGTAQCAVPASLDAAARERFRSIDHFDCDSVGKIVTSNFSVRRMTVSLARTPICSPTKILCRWCTLPIG
jgi:hypothetical protein